MRKLNMIRFNLIHSGDWDFKLKPVFKKITKAVAKMEMIRGRHIVSFIMVNLTEIERINREYRHLDVPTDVISFAEIDSSEERNLPYELGDIFICVERAKSQAKEYGHSELRELAFLATHGLFHLLGYDHQNPSDEAVMFKKQEDVLSLLKIERK